MAVFGTAVASTVGLPAMPSQANPFGTDSVHTGPFADSATHTYCLGGSLSSEAYLYFVDQMSYLGDATTMTDSGPQACGSTTDVIASNVNLDPGDLGDYDCFDYVSSGICARSRVRIDEAYINTFTYDTMSLRATICHEIGHSTGLQHYGVAGIMAPEGQSDCMRSGGAPSNADTWHLYGAHNKAHINDYY